MQTSANTPQSKTWSDQRAKRDTPPQATVTLERNGLMRALAMLTKITPKNPSMAALKSLHVTTSGNLVKLTSSNLELTLTTELPSIKRSAHAAELDMLIPCLELERLLKTANSNDVVLEQFDGRARIVCESVSFELPRAGLLSFPSLVPHGSPTLTLHADQLSTALRRVLYAVDKRNYGGLAGVQLELSEQRSRVVSSNGYILTLTDFDAPSTPSPKLQPARYLIPTAGALALERLFKKGEVNIAVAHNYLVFSTPTMRLTLRLNDKRFPDYTQIIPTASEFNLSAERAVVLQAIKHLQANQREAKILTLNIDSSSMTLLLRDGNPSNHQIVAINSNAQDTVTLEYHLTYFAKAVANADERFNMTFSPKGVTVISNQSQTLMALLRPRLF